MAYEIPEYICPDCGKNVPQADVVCRNCGANLLPGVGPVIPERYIGRGGKLFLIVSFAVLLFECLAIHHLYVPDGWYWSHIVSTMRDIAADADNYRSKSAVDPNGDRSFIGYNGGIDSFTTGPWSAREAWERFKLSGITKDTIVIQGTRNEPGISFDWGKVDSTYSVEATVNRHGDIVMLRYYLDSKMVYESR